MADDRHEALRIVFGTAEINRLLDEFKDEDRAWIIYNMLMVKHHNPSWLVPGVVNETRKYLKARRARRSNSNEG